MLAEMGDPKAAICLLTPYASPASAPEVKAAAASALQRLDGRLPTRAEAARRLTDAAIAYFDRRQPIEGGRDGRVNVWRWDAAKNGCLARSYTLDEAAGRMAARWAREALGLAGDDATAAVFSLAADLDVRAAVNGLDRPLPPVAAQGAMELEARPERAPIRDGPSAHGSRRGGRADLGPHRHGEQVLYQGASLSPLVVAVRDPDRRLQVAALEAIVRLHPIRAFAGSSYVPDALAFLASAQGARRAAVASVGSAKVRDLAGLAIASGISKPTVAKRGAIWCFRPRGRPTMNWR